MNCHINENLFYAGKRRKIVCAGDCYHVKGIKLETHIVYNSLEEAIADGCRPCKHCNGLHKVKTDKETKRIVTQNLEPNVIDAKWDGTKVIAINWSGDEDVLACFGLTFDKINKWGLQMAWTSARNKHMKNAEEWGMI